MRVSDKKIFFPETFYFLHLIRYNAENQYVGKFSKPISLVRSSVVFRSWIGGIVDRENFTGGQMIRPEYAVSMDLTPEASPDLLSILWSSQKFFDPTTNQNTSIIYALNRLNPYHCEDAILAGGQGLRFHRFKMERK